MKSKKFSPTGVLLIVSLLCLIGIAIGGYSAQKQNDANSNIVACQLQPEPDTACAVVLQFAVLNIAGMAGLTALALAMFGVLVLALFGKLPETPNMGSLPD
ncbi:MAG: hypothetical protein UU16_C0051G0006 [Candidatus Woesebacteria bacterium GW2011_GWA2_40_7]|uniref:Uncharacterized protein n=2 Tax=Candidatus Woeseibacteriota TaxID=1752722 RepID=A0A0G0LI48_9BACT|nr:MAG: hypothetical protein UT17_C0005G0008 [Candidatus Woesebacteria bacterium GW2011_GWB1_39_10]KKR71873.1 MAG: hypothetical protein UU16_C0051G0006 [Candidatus Woesebacteria bacterium GW2011_GWA2_40_7]